MGSGFESRGVYQGKWLRQAEKALNKGQSASARTYLGRLKKSRDLVSDKPGQFRTTEIGRVAVSRVAVSRDNVTAQQGNVTPLFPEYDDEETMEMS